MTPPSARTTWSPLWKASRTKACLPIPTPQRSDGAYELTDFGREHRAELDDAMSMPLVAVHYADQTGMDLDQLKAAYDAGMVQKPDVQTMLDEAKSQMGDMADSIVDQQAIAAAKAEYEQLGLRPD